MKEARLLCGTGHMNMVVWEYTTTYVEDRDLHRELSVLDDKLFTWEIVRYTLYVGCKKHGTHNFTHEGQYRAETIKKVLSKWASAMRKRVH